VIAPDGLEVRLLGRCRGGSYAHFRLPPGCTGRAVRHRTIEETWFVASGEGRIWFEAGGRSAVRRLAAGMGFIIPPGTAFQLRCSGPEALGIIATTMPPWPGEGEADVVPGHWPPSV
jgi:mannose-6-phosphate isomerase-like protein (cupin superfamily)